VLDALFSGELKQLVGTPLTDQLKTEFPQDVRHLRGLENRS